MAYNFKPLNERIQGVIDWLGTEYLGVRTGRATPALLDSVEVEIYGARQPLKHIASISIEDPRTLRVSLWDKAQMKAAESALAGANLGLSVAPDSSGIRIIFPTLTAERRVMLQKLVKEKMEEARVSVRSEREKIWNDIQAKEKSGELSEDEKFRLKDELQKIIDQANEKLQALADKKDKEISE